jgi:hypothetical protein
MSHTEERLGSVVFVRCDIADCPVCSLLAHIGSISGGIQFDTGTLRLKCGVPPVTALCECLLCGTQYTVPVDIAAETIRCGKCVAEDFVRAHGRAALGAQDIDALPGDYPLRRKG